VLLGYAAATAGQGLALTGSDGDGGDFAAESGAAEDFDYRFADARAIDYDRAVAESADNGDDAGDHAGIRGAERYAFEMADQQVLACALDDCDGCVVAAFAEVDSDIEHSKILSPRMNTNTVKDRGARQRYPGWLPPDRGRRGRRRGR